MGYSHYWKKTKVTEQETWNKFRDFVLKLIKKVNGKNVLNSADDEEVELILRDSWGEADSEPEVTEQFVAFNGNEDLSHETFAIEREVVSDFIFCKTARKPYDVAVVACLIEAKHLGIIDSWDSDGKENDHKGGKALRELLSNNIISTDDLVKDLMEAIAEREGKQMVEIADHYISNMEYAYLGDGVFNKIERLRQKEISMKEFMGDLADKIVLLDGKELVDLADSLISNHTYEYKGDGMFRKS